MSYLPGRWSTADIPDQSGRLVVITGGNSGIGLEAAKELAAKGADVLIATRSAEKGEAAVDQIKAGASADSTVWREQLDLASLASVREFAAGRKADGRPIDTLIANAGIMLVPARVLTEDGFELQFQTNFLGHYLLTAELLDLLRAGTAPRFVSIGSIAIHTSWINLGDLNAAGNYISWLVYCQSKLASLMLAVELNRRSREGDWGIVATGAHPGFARTNLQVTGPEMGNPGFNAVEASGKIPGLSHSARAGSLPTLMAATIPTLGGGEYFGPFFEVVGAPAQRPLPVRARMQGKIDGLWAAAEKMTGVAWPTGSLPDLTAR